MRSTLLLLALFLASPAPAQAQNLTRDDYASFRKEIELRAHDLAWQRIDWKANVFDGLALAQRLDRPLFVWLFFGDPRGHC